MNRLTCTSLLLVNIPMPSHGHKNMCCSTGTYCTVNAAIVDHRTSFRKLTLSYLLRDYHVMIWERGESNSARDLGWCVFTSESSYCTARRRRYNKMESNLRPETSGIEIANLTHHRYYPGYPQQYPDPYPPDPATHCTDTGLPQAGKQVMGIPIGTSECYLS